MECFESTIFQYITGERNIYAIFCEANSIIMYEVMISLYVSGAGEVAMMKYCKLLQIDLSTVAGEMMASTSGQVATLAQTCDDC